MLFLRFIDLSIIVFLNDDDADVFSLHCNKNQQKSFSKNVHTFGWTVPLFGKMPCDAILMLYLIFLHSVKYSHWYSWRTVGINENMKVSNQMADKSSHHCVEIWICLFVAYNFIPEASICWGSSPARIQAILFCAGHVLIYEI